MSMTPAFRRILPVVAVAVPALLLATPVYEAGITYDFRISGTAVQGDKTREVTSMTGRGQVAGANARVDITEAKNGGPMVDKKGGYIIVKDGGKTMYMVDPGEKQYFAFNTEQLMAGVGSTLKMVGGLVKMTMSDVSIDVQDLGAGEKIQGYSTRHMRQTQSYTMSVSVLGRKNSTTSADTTDFWIATELKHVGNPFLNMSAAATGLDFGNPDYERQQKAAQAKMPAGMPLKSVSRNHSTDDKGAATVTTTTMEVTNFQKGDIPASAFAIPGDYKEVQMPYAELAAMGDSVDAARARGGAEASGPDSESIKDAVKEGAKEGAKAGVKEEAKKAIRGIFRKP